MRKAPHAAAIAKMAAPMPTRQPANAKAPQAIQQAPDVSVVIPKASTPLAPQAPPEKKTDAAATELRKIATPQQTTTAVKTSTVASPKPEPVPKAMQAEGENAKLLALAMQKIQALESELKDLKEAKAVPVTRSKSLEEMDLKTPKNRTPVMTPPPSSQLIRSASAISSDEAKEVETGDDDMVAMPDGHPVALKHSCHKCGVL